MDWSLLPGSLAGLVDMLVDVLDGGQFGDTRLGLLVGDLGSCRGEVLITLNRTQSVNSNRVWTEIRGWGWGYGLKRAETLQFAGSWKCVHAS